MAVRAAWADCAAAVVAAVLVWEVAAFAADPLALEEKETDEPLERLPASAGTSQATRRALTKSSVPLRRMKSTKDREVNIQKSSSTMRAECFTVYVYKVSYLCRQEEMRGHENVTLPSLL